MNAAVENRPNITGHAFWFAIPVTDMEKSQTFYETVLGIKMVTDQDEPSNPMTFFQPMGTPGRFGHLYKGKPATEGAGNTIHILCNDKLETVIPRVEKAGGKIVTPIIEIKSSRFVQITDPDGNSVGLVNWL